MSRDASGNYNLYSANPVVFGTTILSDGWANPTLSDIGAALTDSLSRTGKGGMSAPLVMNGYKVTAIGPATTGVDAPQAVQIRDSVFNRLADAASDTSGNIYTATSPIQSPLVNGTLFLFVADKPNTGAMKLVVNASSALDILINGIAVPPGVVVAGAVIGVMFLNGAWRITNTAGAVGTINTVQSDNLDAISVLNDPNLAVATLNIHANVPRGLAQLDANSKILASQMPFSTLSFIGSWDASGGTTPPQAGVANGSVYLIVAAGTIPLYRPDAPGSNNYTLQATPVNVNDQIIFKTPAGTGQPVGWYYSPAPSGTATAANVSMVATPNPPFAGITNVQTWLNAADPAITGKVNIAGITVLTGDIRQPNVTPANATSLVNAQYVINAINDVPLALLTFMGRSDQAAILLPADITSALGYTPANAATQVFTGAIGATTGTFSGAVSAKAFTQNQYTATITGAYNADYLNGQSQILTISPGPTTITPANIPVGSILRLVLIGVATNVTVLWSASVAWPLGATPDLSLGPLKKAVVVLEWDGAKYLASSSAY